MGEATPATPLASSVFVIISSPCCCRDIRKMDHFPRLWTLCLDVSITKEKRTSLQVGVLVWGGGASVVMSANSLFRLSSDGVKSQANTEL